MKSKLTAKPLIFGISGPSLTQAERDFFSTRLVIGFILFKRNIESEEQLHTLVKDLRGLYLEKKILIFVDQEGGKVARLKPPLIAEEYPEAQFFCQTYLKEGSKKAIEITKNSYKKLMNDLKKYDLDSPCCPVADLHFDFADQIIGDRSFGKTSSQVVDLCKAAISGIEEAEGIPIIKHIPGHGRALCDSHLKLPRVETQLEELNNTDFKVFRQLSSSVKWAMIAHILYDCLDPELPATLSPKVINFIREKIGFQGIIVTDDICMLALHGKIGQQYFEAKNSLDKVHEEINTLKRLFIESLVNVTKKSIAAGCNVVLHCSGDIDEIHAVYKAIT